MDFSSTIRKVRNVVLTVGCLIGPFVSKGQTVTVTGNALLENGSDHSGIEVVFNKIAPAPLGQSSVFTGVTGSFVSILSPGIYEITIRKSSYFSAFLGQVNCFADTGLPERTLLARQTLIRVPNHFERIQDAINDSFYGDTVLLERGTYLENIKTNGKAILLTSNFVFTHDIDDIKQTVIDGGNIKSVIVCDLFETPQTILSAFTIRNGNATGFYPEWFGGGIRCINTSPTLQHLIIRDNHADYGGGGVYLIHSNSILSHLMILDNTCGRDGGGVRVTSSTPTISNCVIARNTAETGGGVTCNYFSGTVVTTTIINSTIAYNHVTLNSSNDFNGGAGIKLTGANLSLINSLIAYNTGDYGVSFFNQGIASYPLISHSGFFGNGNDFYQCNPLNGPIATQNINGDPVDAYFNVFGEVHFTDPDNDDFGLSQGDQAVDAGENSAVTVTVDVEMNTRIQNDNGLISGRVNLGAIEGISGPPPSIAAVAPICVGEEVTVSIESDGSEFTWFKTADDQDVLGQTSNLVVIDTLTEGAEFFISNTSLTRPSRRTRVEINVHPMPDFSIEASLESHTSYGFQVSSDAGIESYAWGVEGTSLTSTEASPVFEFPSSGVYEVCLLASNPGCEIEVCENVDLVITGFLNEAKSYFHVYPNPVQDNLNFVVSPADYILGIEIVNSSGQMVHRGDHQRNEVSLEHLPSGLYVVKVRTALEDKPKVFRIVKVGNN